MVRRLPLHRLVNALNLKAYVPTPFPTARQVEQMPGGFKVLDASGQRPGVHLRAGHARTSRHRKGAYVR